MGHAWRVRVAADRTSFYGWAELVSVSSRLTKA